MGINLFYHLEFLNTVSKQIFLTYENILFCVWWLQYKMNIFIPKFPNEAPNKRDMNNQLLLRRDAESHNFVAAADASHQQAGKHDAHYLEGKQTISLCPVALF